MLVQTVETPGRILKLLNMYISSPLIELTFNVKNRVCHSRYGIVSAQRGSEGATNRNDLSQCTFLAQRWAAGLKKTFGGSFRLFFSVQFFRLLLVCN